MLFRSRGASLLWTGPDDQSICQLTPPPNVVIAISPFPRVSVPRFSPPVYYASRLQPSVRSPFGHLHPILGNRSVRQAALPQRSLLPSHVGPSIRSHLFAQRLDALSDGGVEENASRGSYTAGQHVHCQFSALHHVRGAQRSGHPAVWIRPNLVAMPLSAAAPSARITYYLC